MQCDTPFFARNRMGESIPVRCGRCPPCKRHRVESWVFRMLQEDKVSTSAHFVTLTYDSKFVPISSNGFMTLRKSDLQNFLKRLRKTCPFSRIKYYAAGEYGTIRKRPHYHLIVFNVPDPKFFADAWSLGGSQLGRVDVGKVSGNSIAYTTKYIDKSSFVKKHLRDDRVPEFSLMSKGLGASYMSDSVKAYHQADISRVYATELGGRRIALPRYYRKKLYTEQQQAAQVLLIDEAVRRKDDELRLYFDRLYPDVNPDLLTFESWKYGHVRGRQAAFIARQKSRDKP